MPCDQIQTVEVEFKEGTDLDALALALEGLGLTAVRRVGNRVEFGEGTFEAGRFEFWGRSLDREQIARAYTKATVLNQSERFGWTAKVQSTAQKALAFAGFTRKW